MLYAAPKLVGKRKKVGREEFAIPEFGEEVAIAETDFNVVQLKAVCAYHGLKRSGNKEQLRTRCYSFLKLSKVVETMQSHVRGALQRKLDRLRGPGLFNRSICTNSADFLTFDETSAIHPHSYFSYKDESGKIWAFDILSIHTHLQKNGQGAMNPFTRESFPPNATMETRLGRIRHIARMLGIDVDVSFEDATYDVHDIESRAGELFRKFDSFGHLTDHSWLMGLTKQKLLDMYKALHDIWTYRANLAYETMVAIHSPAGRPFDGFSWTNLCASEREGVLSEMVRLGNRFANDAIDDHHQQLGVYYVLGSLTTVSPDAATALPWLYQSVS